MHRDFVRQIRRLQTDADAVLQFLFLPIGIKVKDGDVTAGTRAQPFENFDRGCFARPVRPEQSENFAGAHFEIDAFDGFECAVRFPETAYVNGKIIVHAFEWGERLAELKRVRTINFRHPESRDCEIEGSRIASFRVSPRDPSTSLGMTVCR